MRPYCIESLKKLSKHFDIYVYTSTTKNIANQIMQFLDPARKIFLGLLSEEQCFGSLLKDLRVIINRDFKDMVLVDSVSYSFSSQLDNGIPLLFWDGNPDDCELKYLTKYLIKANFSPDIRMENRNWLRLSELACERNLALL